MRGAALLTMTLLASSFKVGLSAEHQKLEPKFQTSDRCIACHNGLTTPSGQDVPIGFDWRASIMANSPRDPYWQASARRETMDHPESKPTIEDECSVRHMPVTRYEAKLRGQPGEIFSHLPFNVKKAEGRQAEDGVDCAVCHQIGKEKLGTPASYNGEFVIDAPDFKGAHPEYGPFDSVAGNQHIMQTSTGGFRPTDDLHIRESKLCATCHTLITTARGAGGNKIGELNGQMPYPEWLHSDYRDKQTCQDCYMPKVNEQTPIAKVLGVPREGLHQHLFVAADFFMQRMLNRCRDERIFFESGALNPDGSIQGPDNDADATRFEPHYREINRPDQVQIYESILGDQYGRVTTGLISATGYLKDNRLLPYGFDKLTADKQIAVYGEAADDPNFTGAGDRIRYSIALGDAQGPFRVDAQLWYQPIGFRWANNLKP